MMYRSWARGNYTARLFFHQVNFHTYSHKQSQKVFGPFWDTKWDLQLQDVSIRQQTLRMCFELLSVPYCYHVVDSSLPF